MSQKARQEFAGFSLTGTGLASRAASAVAPVNVPGASLTVAAEGINDSGQIAGVLGSGAGATKRTTFVRQVGV